MALIKSKIQEKIPKLPEKIQKPIKELTLTEISNIRIEKQRKEAQDIKDAAKAAKVEKKRMYALIVPYLDKLQEKCAKDHLLSFWIFPDDAGFVKIKNIRYDDMVKLIAADPEKYKNRLISNLEMAFYHNDDPKSTRRRLGIYMITEIIIYPISSTGVMCGENKAWGATISWEMDDFKTTEFSFKLLQVIFRQVVRKVYTTASIFGTPLTEVIKELDKKKVNFYDTLKPLKDSILL